MRGNWTSTVHKGPYGIDTVAPGGTIAINGGARSTTSTSVTIDNAITGAAEMRFANSEAELATAAWEPYAATKAWTLPTGSGEKTVWGEFRDGAGNAYRTSDSIRLRQAKK